MLLNRTDECKLLHIKWSNLLLLTSDLFQSSIVVKPKAVLEDFTSEVEGGVVFIG